VEVSPDDEETPDWGLVQECRLVSLCQHIYQSCHHFCHDNLQALVSDEASAPTAALSPDRSKPTRTPAAQVDRLSMSFPELSSDQIAASYRDHDGNVEATTEALLSLALAAEANPSPLTKAEKRSSAPVDAPPRRPPAGAKSRRTSVYVSRTELRRASVMMTEQMVGGVNGRYQSWLDRVLL
jgi:hypothetical protein